jgi:flagellar hook-associated protein 2
MPTMVGESRRAMNLSSLLGLVSSQNNSVNGLSLPRQFGVSQPATATTGTNGSAAVKLSDYGRLKSGLSDLSAATTKLDTADKVSKVTAKSSNPKIVATAAGNDVQAVAASVQVNQLAQSQVVQSKPFGPNDSQIIGTGSLNIELGNFNASSNTFTPGSQPSVSIYIGVLDGTLGGVANAINRAGAGVSASVVTDANGVHLALSSTKTGANQAFRVTVTDADGNNTDSANGLSRLAFDPSAAAGAGQNLVPTQAAQNASLVIDGRPYTSVSNTVTGAVPGVTIEASATGNAQLSLSRDADAALKSAKAFTTAFNQLRDQLSAVQSDGLARQIASSISSAATSAEVGTGTGQLGLSAAGITQGSDGKLALDEARFKQAFAGNPDGAADLIATASRRVASAADNAINGPLRRATQAVQTATGNGDNPYVVQAAQARFQPYTLSGLPTLLSYSPTTRNLYGLAQYLAVSGL